MQREVLRSWVGSKTCGGRGEHCHIYMVAVSAVEGDAAPRVRQLPIALQTFSGRGRGILVESDRDQQCSSQKWLGRGS